MGLAIINSTVHWGFEGYFEEYQLKIVLNGDASITIVEKVLLKISRKQLFLRIKLFLWNKKFYISTRSIFCQIHISRVISNYRDRSFH